MAKKKEEQDKKIKTSGKGEKIADMSVVEETPVEEEKIALEQPTEQPKEKPVSPPKTRGKKYQAAKSQITKNTVLPIPEAIALLCKLNKDSKFVQTIEVHLTVITKGLSGEVALPHFQGKQRKVAIFNDKLAEEIKTGKVNFDVLLATPADMAKILPLAKVLGPKGLMPNPKNGTVSPDPKKAMEKFSAGALFFKTEKDFPLIHVSIGKANQPEKELIVNLVTLLKAINPKNITKAVVKSTMSPAIAFAFNL